MTQTMTKSPKVQRDALRSYYNQGIKPVDGRQPIPEELAQQMVKELVDAGVDKNADIGIYDTFLILALTLQEHGFNNITVLENVHQSLTVAQEKYYNTIQRACDKISVTYYVPPMNNYNRCDMKFDVIIGNPPYQREKTGERGGSSSSPLWWDFTNIAFNLVKDGGFVSLITPDNIMNGGEQFTSLLLGKNAKYDLKSVDFSVNDHFSIGIKICQWFAVKSQPTNNASNNGNFFDPTKVGVIYESEELNSILFQLCNYDAEKLNFNTANRWDKSPIIKNLLKENKDASLAELKSDPSDLYPYAVANNDKIKYSHIPSKDTGIWRVFVPQFSSTTKFFIDDTMSATASTWTHRCQSKDEAEYIKNIVSDPRYVWVIDQLKVSKRISSSIRYLPIAPIDQVLNSDQLSYIESQL